MSRYNFDVVLPCRSKAIPDHIMGHMMMKVITTSIVAELLEVKLGLNS